MSGLDPRSRRPDESPTPPEPPAAARPVGVADTAPRRASGPAPSRRGRRHAVLRTGLRRLVHILWVGLRHGSGHWLGGRLVRRWPRFFGRLRLQDVAGPDRLRRLFEDIGGTFVKFGQMLALQPDVLPMAYCNALFKLLDRVDPFAWEDVERIVTENLGAHPDQLFDRFERTPLATASVGQVHVAWVDEQKVAVKVQRPNVEHEFAADVRMMVATIAIIRALRLRFLAWLVEPMSEFVDWTEEELDYRFEARYGTQLRENARDNPVQYVPRIYARFTTRRTLVVEFLDGVTLLDYLRARDEGDEVLMQRLSSKGFDRKRFAANVIDNFLGDCFRHGLYHADLHPANLMILDDSVVGYIDFGITGAMSPYSRRHLVAMTLALALGDTEGLHREFLCLSAASASADPDGLYTELAALAGQWYEEREGGRRLRVSFTRVCRDMLAASRTTGVLPERDIVKYIRSAIAIDGLSSRFEPEFDIGHRLALVCGGHIRSETLARTTNVHNLLAMSTSSARLLVGGAARSMRAVDRFAGGDVPLHAEMRSDDSGAAERDRAVHLAGFVAGLAVLMTWTEPAPILGFNLFTVELALAAGGIGLLIPRLWRLSRRAVTP